MLQSHTATSCYDHKYPHHATVTHINIRLWPHTSTTCYSRTHQHHATDMPPASMRLDCKRTLFIVGMLMHCVSDDLTKQPPYDHDAGDTTINSLDWHPSTCAGRAKSLAVSVVQSGPWQALQLTHKQAQSVPVSFPEARLASGSKALTKQSTPFSAASAFSLQHRQCRC